MKQKLLSFLLVAIIILSIFVFSSCGKGSIIKEHYSDVIDYFKSVLTVPDSLIIKSAEGVWSDDFNQITYKITYDAQNKYGIYGGYEDIYFNYVIDKDLVYYNENGKTAFDLGKSMYNLQKEGSKFDATYYYKKIK